ncbi:DUF4397 domain-containing protein [Natronosalvus halobius]|uniref:DUF4397 domain-containing protein n=1 Tax=Natronosalvus halobius TaxID=2953746 RepID=UPI0020A22864|nr:DUF4397 domain-containing protein [Natronosalvus halobius]USZ70666.1 DUF4397 domain-containing protein [Natronosalvus halobius]
MTRTRPTALESLDGAGRSIQIAGSEGEHDPVFTVNDHEHEDESDTPLTAVRVTHLAPGAPSVDVAVDGESIVSGIASERTTPYFVVEPGTHDVTITATGDEETVFYDESIALETAFYTIAVLDAPEEAVRVELLSDAGSALLRLVHAAPDAPAVDVRDAESERAVFDGVAFGRGTNYVALPSGSYTLEVVPAAAGNGASGVSAGGGEARGGESETSDGEEPSDDEETTNDEETSADGENRTDQSQDAVATVTVELEANTAYTAFAEGFLDPDTDTDRPDRAFTVQLTEDGPAALEESEVEPEPGSEPESGERAPGDDDDSDRGDNGDEAGMDETDGGADDGDDDGDGAPQDDTNRD